MESQSDPRTYFKFKSCSRCFYKPCDRLRFGGVFPGKFHIVHNSMLGVAFIDCPFVARQFDEIESLLSHIPEEDLIERIDSVLQLLAPAERQYFRQEDYLNGASDGAGRVRFIQALWEGNVVNILRIPRFFKTDSVIRRWLYAYEGLVYALQKPELANKDEGAAATDALADAQGQKKLMNPRWKHVDPDRDKESPEVAAVGDKVTLMASATNFPDGSEVTFDIYDESGDAPGKIDSVQGSVDGGRAEAVWTVADPNDAGKDLDLQFEAIAEDLSSGKASIATKVVFEILLQIDVDDPAAQDDELILLDENNNEVKKLPVKDMKEVSEDIVRIRLEDIDMDKKYSMIRDYGAEDDGGHDPLFINLTPKELMKFSKVSDDEAEEDSEDKEGGGDEDASGEGDSSSEGDSEGSDDGDSASSSDDDSWALIESDQSEEPENPENPVKSDNPSSADDGNGGEEILSAPGVSKSREDEGSGGEEILSAPGVSKGREDEGSGGEEILSAPGVSKSREDEGSGGEEILSAPGLSKGREDEGSGGEEILSAPGVSKGREDEGSGGEEILNTPSASNKSGVIEGVVDNREGGKEGENDA